VRRNIRVAQAALDCCPKKFAVWLIDATDNDLNAAESISNRSGRGYVNFPSTSAVTDHVCYFMGARFVAARNHHMSRILRCKFGRDTLPNYAVPTNDQYA
jgi:hypothetical protein